MIMTISRRTALSVFAAAMIGLLSAATTPVQAAPLSDAQTEGLTSCLVACIKGDSNCQNSCSAKAAGESFAKASGACVSACADALVVPGGGDTVKSDLKQCLAACN